MTVVHPDSIDGVLLRLGAITEHECEFQAHHVVRAAVDAKRTIEALREALDLVVQHDPTTPGLSFDSHLQLLESAVGIARAALSPIKASDADRREVKT